MIGTLGQWLLGLRLRHALFALLVASLFASPGFAATEPPYPVGLKQIEFTDGERQLALAMFYPAALSDSSAKPAGLPFFTNLHLYRDAGLVEGRHPLVMLSHGRGSNPLQYAWFAETLASQGYIVAGLYHYRANTYDQSIAYLSNKIWQRPRDISSAIDFLLKDKVWGKAIDAERIGVAGHSQGGFTSLWIGGAKVNADKFLAFQQGWKNNQQVPAYLRDAAAARSRARARRARHARQGRLRHGARHHQGVRHGRGGARQMSIPAYITVGARDTQTPPDDNAAFAAANIPGAKLVIIPGLVDHEIFVNECDDEGRDEFPEACIDAPGVDRHAIHQEVGAAALKFFDAHLPSEGGK